VIRKTKTLMLILLLTPSLAVAAAAEEPGGFNMPYGVTPTSHDVYDMHMLLFWVCTVIGALVFAVMIWSLVFHRRARGAVAAKFSGHTRLEIVWTAIPALILVAVAIPATRVLLAVNAHPHPYVTVDIHGSQWKWHYSYPDQGIAYYSNLKADSRKASREHSGISPATVPYYLRDVDHPLVLPVGKDVRLRITGDDVIHSWWVPQLGFKRDAIPGFINRADIVIDKPGIYRGQCAELCGAGHGFMPIVVKAVSPAEFLAWVTQSKKAEAAEHESEQGPWTRQLAMTQGKKIFDSVCAACHQLNGKGIPGVFPALDGSKIVNGPLAGHIKFVVHGSPRNPVMRPFGKEMNNRQLAAVLTYERNSWSNHTGDLVTPEEVEKAR
jgi:cytochrome c oxidase subunit II